MAQLPKSKWVPGVSRKDAVSSVARQSLEERLALVWYYLPLAAEQAEDDIEYVHQLRVATRRAAAALELFRDLLPQKRSRWMHRKLRRVRTAAGPARDLDVLAARLAQDKTVDDAAAREVVLAAIARHRASVQEPIHDAYDLLSTRDYPRRVAKLLKRIRWRDEGQEPTLSKAGRAALTPIAQEFFAAGAADMNQAENLHQLRIRAKHLRYAVELLAGGFDPSLKKDLYPEIEDIQTRLGKINDHVTAASKYRAWQEQFEDQPAELLGRLVVQEEADFAFDAAAFRKWWTPARRNDFEQRLGTLLAGS